MIQSTSQPDKKYIFIDSCVIQYGGDKNKSKSEVVIECFTSLVADNYSLAISEVTIYENLHGLWGRRAIKAADLLGTYEKKIVSNNVLTLAAMLGGLYHEEKLDGIDMGDKIIAATAILENGLVLTANHKDYPSPFFTSIKDFPLAYKVGHHTNTLDISLYKPNTDLIIRRSEEKDR